MWKMYLIVAVLTVGLVLGNYMGINKPSEANVTILKAEIGTKIMYKTRTVVEDTDYGVVNIEIKNTGKFGFCTLKVVDEDGNVQKSEENIKLVAGGRLEKSLEVLKKPNLRVQVYSLQRKAWVKTDEKAVFEPLVKP